MIEYRCPHCDTVLDAVIYVQSIPVHAAVDGAPRRRRTLTATRFAEVATAYARGGAKAVERDLGVSKAQSYRLVAQARDAGHLAGDG